MSDAVLDRGIYFPSPITDWHRERPFKVAVVASLVIHAALIALVPGFRSVTIEPPRVLNVEIVIPEPQAVQRVLLPEVAPPPPQRAVEETVVPPRPEIEPKPEPLMRQPEPETPPVPRAEILAQPPRPEPRPEPLAVARPELRPEPHLEPRVEAKPEPRIDPRPEPPPVAAPAPPPAPSQPAALQSQANVPAAEPRWLLTYGQSISKEIRRYQKYPPLAQRRGWEGTAEVLLKIAADGKVTGITLGKSSGRTVLDEEALNMVRRASPLPQAPQDLRGRELTVTVPIVFKLQES